MTKVISHLFATCSSDQVVFECLEYVATENTLERIDAEKVLLELIVGAERGGSEFARGAAVRVAKLYGFDELAVQLRKKGKDCNGEWVDAMMSDF